MGCGHSKINIYPRRNRAKTSHKKSITQDKLETEEEEGVETEGEANENLEDCDQRKTIKVKSFGGPLLAQTEISTSQQDFFRMLDEKIRCGPDYNSDCEMEKAVETARLNALLKDWETASAGSRSLPPTPVRRLKPTAVSDRIKEGTRSAEISRDVGRQPPPLDRTYMQSQIPQSVIHQSYGVTQQISYRPITYNNPSYIPPSPAHQISQISYPSAMQYQAISPMYANQPQYQPPPQRKYPNYNQHGTPIKTYVNNSSPKHIPYDQPIVCSPSHKLYGPPVPPPIPTMIKPVYSNGELVQQAMYVHPNSQIQYHKQYKDPREQVVLGQQAQPSYKVQRNYQSSVTIPIVVKNQQQSDVGAIHRKQYELT